MVSPKIISFVYNQGIKSVACNKSCSKGICGLVLIDALNGHLSWPWYQVNTRLTLNWHLDRHSINTQLGVDGWQSVERLMYLLTLTGQFNSRLALNQVLTKYKWRCWVSESSVNCRYQQTLFHWCHYYLWIPDTIRPQSFCKVQVPKQSNLIELIKHNQTRSNSIWM